MNKQQAYNAFWGDFGVFAFEENSIPDDTVIQSLIDKGVAPSKYPYIAYEVIVDDLNNAVYPSASIYDNSSSWERLDLLVNTISTRIQTMKTIRLDNGRMFITKGSPFAQHMGEGEGFEIKRVVLNLGVEFFTEN